jgi:hypothetical protein
LGNTRPERVLSGSVNYFRIVPQQWRVRLRWARWMGLDTVETYVPWNPHEPKPGEFGFDGGLDVVRFLETAQGEVELRTSDPAYLARVKTWWDELLPRVRPLQVCAGDRDDHDAASAETPLPGGAPGGEPRPDQLRPRTRRPQGHPGRHPGEADGPLLAHGTFTVDAVGDAFVGLPGFAKDVVWVNGFTLGRYWDRGPQQTLYLPGPVLKQGVNDLHVLELHHVLDPEARFTGTPVLG